MDSRNLRHLADVALSRGAPSNQPPSPLTSLTPSIDIERLPASQTLRHFPSMPHINRYFQQNGQSPPHHNRIPAPTPQTRTPFASPSARRQPQHEEPFANLVEQLTALLDRCSFEIRRKSARQQSVVTVVVKIYPRTLEV